LAKEKAPSIIFIDEVDAIGTKWFDMYPFRPFGLPFKAEDFCPMYELVNQSSRSLYALLVCPSQPTKIWQHLKKIIVIRDSYSLTFFNLCSTTTKDLKNFDIIFSLQRVLWSILISSQPTKLWHY
jgi:hypothetical protein